MAENVLPPNVRIDRTQRGINFTNTITLYGNHYSSEEILRLGNGDREAGMKRIAEAHAKQKLGKNDAPPENVKTTAFNDEELYGKSKTG